MANYNKIIDRTEEIKNDLQKFIDNGVKSGCKADYQDYVTIYLIHRIAILETRLSNLKEHVLWKKQ